MGASGVSGPYPASDGGRQTVSPLSKENRLLGAKEDHLAERQPDRLALGVSSPLVRLGGFSR